MSISRRTMLRQLAALASIPFASTLLPRGATSLDGTKATVLEAAVDRLLPGAKDAGVMNFIVYWFKDEAFTPLERYFAIGADRLDDVATRHHRTPFIRLDDSGMDDVLSRFMRGEIKSRGFDGRLFFQQMLELTIEGYLSDPKYGGNKDRIGWKTIGRPDGLRSCWWNPDGVQMVLDPEDGFND